ncbi:MAG: type II/IV secretion system ATPase subunit [Candidatus Methanoperedens sp.]|nr:type II/IV secretion system ATPase subunit [Candidatus Methanoperedens sp.]
MMAHEGVEGREETLKGQVSGTKTTGNKQFSLSTFGSILIMFSILLFAVSMVSSIMKIWDFSYSLGIQVIAILSMVTGYTLRNKMIGPEANEKTYLLINTIHEFITSKLIEREITEIPVYDISKHGELVTFTPPQDFDVVEQTWVSRPFTLVTILNNRRTHKNLYNISEPVLTDFEKALLQRIFDSLKVFLLEHEIDFNRMDKELILYKNFIKILDVYGIDLAPPSLHKIWYYMKRDYVGYGKLDVLLKDPMIEDISCDGADISVYLYHRKYTNIETNVVFEEEELNMTILKLAQISGKSISTGYPIMNARLPDGSRLEATLGREVTTRGGTITIRKFREEPFTPADLIKYGTFSTEVMAYLWLAVENNKNIIIVGETAAGKTTTLNAISLFIPSESKVITIEDTRELTLYHKNWIPATIRETYMGQEAANIDMFDLLRSALRQRPEFLLVGEIRGKEAYTLFQAMSTGHTTFSTMHAGSIQTAVNRLLSEPINVPLMMLSSLDIMIIQVLRNVGRRRARRVNVLSEFVGINAATGDISTRELYKWNPLHDVIELGGSSNVLDDIMIRRGWSKEQIIKELENRKAVLQYMVDMDINDYRDVSVIIRRFADSPEEVMDLIREGKTLLSEEHEHK